MRQTTNKTVWRAILGVSIGVSTNLSFAAGASSPYERVEHYYDIVIGYNYLNGHGELGRDSGATATNISHVYVKANECTSTEKAVARNLRGGGAGPGSCWMKRENGVCKVEARLQSNSGGFSDNTSTAPQGGATPFVQCKIHQTRPQKDNLPCTTQLMRTPAHGDPTDNLHIQEGHAYTFIGTPKKTDTDVGVSHTYSLGRRIGLRSGISACEAGDLEKTRGTTQAYSATPPCKYPGATEIKFYDQETCDGPAYGHYRSYLRYNLSDPHATALKQKLDDLIETNAEGSSDERTCVRATVTLKEKFFCAEKAANPNTRRTEICGIWDQSLEIDDVTCPDG